MVRINGGDDAQTKEDFYYTYRLDRTLKVSKNLCDGERFENQPVLSKCTGFLVDEDILMTAGHCIQSERQCGSFKWVFGYEDGVQKFTEDQVYSCKKLITRKLSSGAFSSSDYAIIRLDRKVKNAKVLPFSTSRRISYNEEVLVIGHPDSPTKKSC